MYIYKIQQARRKVVEIYLFKYINMYINTHTYTNIYIFV